MVDNRSGKEIFDDQQAKSVAREIEAWKLAQLAAQLLAGHDLAESLSEDIDVAVAAAGLILARSRREASS